MSTENFTRINQRENLILIEIMIKNKWFKLVLPIKKYWKWSFPNWNIKLWRRSRVRNRTIGKVETTILNHLMTIKNNTRNLMPIPIRKESIRLNNPRSISKNQDHPTFNRLNLNKNLKSNKNLPTTQLKKKKSLRKNIKLHPDLSLLHNNPLQSLPQQKYKKMTMW